MEDRLFRAVLPGMDKRFKTDKNASRTVVYLRSIPLEMVKSLIHAPHYEVLTPHSLRDGEIRSFLNSIKDWVRPVRPLARAFRSKTQEERHFLRCCMREMISGRWPVIYASTITQVLGIMDILAGFAESIGLGLGWIHWGKGYAPERDGPPPIALASLGGDRMFEDAIRWAVNQGGVLIIYTPINPQAREWPLFYRSTIKRLDDAGIILQTKIGAAL